MQEAKPDLRVITELVVNHTSVNTPGSSGRGAAEGLKRADWYVWSDTDQIYKGTRIIFTTPRSRNGHGMMRPSSTIGTASFASARSGLRQSTRGGRHHAGDEALVDAGVRFSTRRSAYLIEREATSNGKLPRPPQLSKSFGPSSMPMHGKIFSPKPHVAGGRAALFRRGRRC